MKDSLFVSSAPLLEPLLAQELEELGIQNIRTGYRGVFVDQWNFETVYRINYASRIASRVFIPLLSFRCRDQDSLYRNASKINWFDYLKVRDTFAIDANVRHPNLKNSLFAAQVVKDAICDQFRDRTGSRPSVDLKTPDLQLNLFIDHQYGLLSLDASGAPLNKRGYRQESVEAPMQETLAAAILRIAKYNPEQDYLLDPCCGSGTLLIEAALIASKTPPGYLRQKWGFMRHPDFSMEAWLKTRNEIDADRTPLKPGIISGIDRAHSAIRAAKINLKAAGFHKEIALSEADFREYEPNPLPNLIIANPPHGRRLEEEEGLKPLYRELGDFLKKRSAKEGRAFIFTTSLELAKEVGLSGKRHCLNLGGLEARLLEYQIF